MMIIWITVIVSFIRVQTDWVSGPGVLGPVSAWGKLYSISDSITYNVEGQICPVATQSDYNAWIKHVIDTSQYICCHSIWAADFDGDGDLDLAGWRGGITLIFYENNNNNFTEVSSYTPWTGNRDWGFISANDLNNDGRIDVVVPGGSGGGLAWFENQGNFSFITHIIDPSNPYHFVETGDIDNDGDIDMITTFDAMPSVNTWVNDSSGNFTIKQNFFNNPWRPELSDLNGDGYLDFIGEYSNKDIYIYFNDSTGYFTHTTHFSVPGVDGLWSRDFDNDGDQDIIVGTISTNGCTSSIYWFENDGTGASYMQHTVNIDNAGWAPYGDGACAEDMDLDGKTDVVSGFSKLAFFRQNALDSFIPYVIDAYGNNFTHWVIPVKFNKYECTGNIGMDILVCRKGAFLWYENQMIKKFSKQAWLESSILDAGYSAKWIHFGYNVCSPFDTALSFQFRTGNNVSDITSTSWSTPVFVNPGIPIDTISLATYASLGDTMFQYRVNLMGKESSAPIVYEIWVEFEEK